jgi:hypothetical protein
MGVVKTVGYSEDVIRAMRLYAECIISDVEASMKILRDAVVSGDWEKIGNAVMDVERNYNDLMMWLSIWSITEAFLIRTGDIKNEKNKEALMKLGAEAVINSSMLTVGAKVLKEFMEQLKRGD